MSTSIYLVCASHIPNIFSDQVCDLREISRVRKNLKNFETIVTFLKEMGNDIEFSDRIDSVSCWFMYSHRNCLIEIWDEYNTQHYPIIPEFPGIPEEVAGCESEATSTPESSG